MLQLFGPSICTRCVRVVTCFYLRRSHDGGLLVSVWWWPTFCVGVTFTSSGGECLHTTGLCFSRLVGTNLSVPYRGFHEIWFRILHWV